jgi:hypothetical protein
MKLKISLGLIILSFLFLSLGCATDQQSTEGDDQIKDNNKPYSPSRNHIPRP